MQVEPPPSERFPTSTIGAMTGAIAALSGDKEPFRTTGFGQGAHFRYPFDGPGLPKTFSVDPPAGHYVRLPEVDPNTQSGRDAICEKHSFPGYTVGISSKGCVNFATSKITDYESFVEFQDVELCMLAWLYNINRGIIMAAGREEEWTLSIAHNDEDVERWVVTFEDLVRDVMR